jgi:hypothetical protein
MVSAADTTRVGVHGQRTSRAPSTAVPFRVTVTDAASLTVPVPWQVAHAWRTQTPLPPHCGHTCRPRCTNPGPTVREKTTTPRPCRAQPSARAHSHQSVASRGLCGRRIVHLARWAGNTVGVGCGANAAARATRYASLEGQRHAPLGSEVGQRVPQPQHHRRRPLATTTEPCSPVPSSQLSPRAPAQTPPDPCCEQSGGGSGRAACDAARGRTRRAGPCRPTPRALVCGEGKPFIVARGRRIAPHGTHLD